MGTGQKTVYKKKLTPHLSITFFLGNGIIPWLGG